MPFMTIEVPYKLSPKENLSRLRIPMIVKKTCCCGVVIMPVAARR
jgi:hypothetical protein